MIKHFAGILAIAAVLLSPVAAVAGIIGDVTLQLDFSTPTGSVTFSPSSMGTYYLDYDVRLNGGDLVEAFCVENTNAPPESQDTRYTLLTIDSGLSAFGLNAANYLAAAWIAQKYYTAYVGDDSKKASAQIAVWEVIFDGIGGSLTTGNFRSNNTYNGFATTILADISDDAIPTSTSGWALAVNPTLAATKNITVYPYQNYLVPVPIPAAAWLLGAGVIGLVAVRRKLWK